MTGLVSVRNVPLAALVLVALVASACDSTRPSPTPPVAPSPVATQVAVETPAPVETPGPTQPPPEPSSVERITAAVVAGEIDEATGYLYRFYAAWGDARLPDAYRGVPTEDSVLARVADSALQSFSPEDQARLRPFLVRPSHPDSYWTADPASQPMATATASTRSTTATLASARAMPGSGGTAGRTTLVNDPRCTDGAWARRELANIPVTIWGRCRVGAGGSTTLAIEAEMTRAAALLNRVWGPMVALMGPPIPDRFRGPTRAADEVAEGGDGRLDVYLTEAPNVAYNRTLDVTHSGAMAPYAAPFDLAAGTSASYIVMDVARRAGAFDQEATMAHELFHVLQSAHNSFGTIVCPYPSTSSSCTSGQTHHWFVEASAQWAVHEFLPTHREYVYSTFRQFRTSKLALASTDQENEYWSFMWPLFMEQETLRGAGIIGDAWDALEGKTGWLAVQAALDGQLRFETSFRDFAVRVWNEKLEPGDPISPRFNHPNLDAAFPTTRADEDPDPVRFLEYEILLPDVQERFQVDLPELWAGYYKLSLPPGAKRLTLNFAGLNPNGQLDVDALVLIRDGEWERRKLDPMVTDWCLERAADAIDDIILVVSNHGQTPNKHIQGTWTAQAESAGCLFAGDGLAYTFTTETGTPGVGYYASRSESLTLRVNLKSNDHTTEYLPDFLNNGSTFRASVQYETFIEGIGGCNSVTEATGGGGGTVPGLDGVVASLSQVFEPVPGGSIGPNGRWILTVAASVAVDVTETTSSCIGSSGGIVEQIIQLPSCDGDEVIDGNPSRTFNFNCSFTNPGYSWSVTGKVTIGG